MRGTSVDEDLGRSLAEGWTLPASWYSDPGIWQLERERIFARSWQFAGPAEWVAEHGDRFATRAGHVPVVVVRDGDVVRAFVNVCRHRAHLVVSGRGRRSTLQCPYHAWTFGLDGCLKSAPRAEDEGLDADALGLLPVACEVFGPAVFVNPDVGAAPLADALGHVPARLAASGVDVGALRLRRTIDWTCDANWKNAVENYLECYHCPVAHPSFSQAIDVRPDRYRLETEGLVLSQHGPARHDGDGPSLPGGPVGESQYHLVFPNTSIDMLPGPPNLSLYAWCPTGPRTMAASSHLWFPDEVTDAEIDEIVAFNNQVNDEDIALIASVQAGLDSGLVPQGRLMPGSERLIGAFQRLVHEHLSAA